MTELDDTTRCDQARRCDTCSGTAELAVATVSTPVGVFCCTLCDECAHMGHLPVMGWSGVIGRTLRHCEHLGIDGDVMAGLLLKEETP